MRTIHQKSQWQKYAKWMVGSSLLALAMHNPLAAQEVDQDRGKIETITVTAQKREQNLQNVPITVNAFGEDFMDQVGAESMKDLTMYTPGLEVSGVTQPRFTMRGISTDDFGVGTDPAVGIYVDGVYASRSGAALVFFNDVERVEVLKGPQGTLFGRNTAAGAISIINNKPTTDEMDANVAVRLGRFGKIRFEGMANVPVSDTFALRVNYLENSQDGWLKDAVSGKKLGAESNAAVRVAARWTPTDSTDFILAYERDRTRNDARPAIGIGAGNLNGGDPFGAFANDVVNLGEDRNLDGVTLTMEFDAGDITFTNITAYKTFNTRNREDEDGTANPALYFDTENWEDNEHIYEEFRFTGDIENLTLTGGISYYWEDARQESRTNATTNTIDTALVGLGIQPFPPFAGTTLLLNQAGYDFNLTGLPWNETMSNHGKYTAGALFGDATLHVTDKLNITFGIRYTEDHKEFSWFNGPRDAQQVDFIQQLIDINDFNFDFVFDLGALEGKEFKVNNKWDNLSKRLVVDYQAYDDLMVFAGYSEGYKAGGYNSVEVNSFFDPEYVENFEIGMKSQWLNDSLRFNATAYVYEYTNKQEISLETITSSGVPQYVTRTGDAEAAGFDAELTWLPSDNMRFFVNYGAIDAEWKNRTQSGVDISGQPTGTPSHRVAYGIDYFFNLDSGDEIRLHYDASLTTKRRQNNACFIAGTCTQQAYGFKTGTMRSFANLRATWTEEGGMWSASLYMQNLFNSRYIEGVNNITTATLGTPFASISMPRTFGLDLRVNF